MSTRPTRIESDGRKRVIPLGSCPWLPDWDITHDHSGQRDPYVMIRKGEGADTVNAISCPIHHTHTIVPTMIDVRPLRRQGRGAWCTGCA
ncbi:hypothetical protein ACF09C_12750 [Streptomyces sp. NPDC014870]|uniref:hypothetical protein n=1 Tax=Streptomyces sp. NPDC014870 TaxID=3364925 RepID=UPI0036FF48B9